ncbi:MAG: acyl-CoA dehydrogenase family protein [Pseudomonadota bacterium]
MDESEDILAMLRDAAGDFIGGRYDRAVLRRDSLKPRAVDRALWREMGDMGWLGLGLPEARGGSGLGIAGATTLAELFGRTLYGAPFLACASMPTELLAALDGAPARELEAMLLAGERLLTLAWQEGAGQIEVGAQATRVQGGRLTGRKLFVPSVQDDSVLLVYAESEGAPVLVAVAADAPGVAFESVAAGINSYASVTFDAAPTLFGAPLGQGRQAAAALERALSAGRIMLSAQLAGLAAGCLEQTIAYVNQRVQFGHPIGVFQTIQHRCVDLHIATMLANASWRHAQGAYQADPYSHAAQAAISAAKARCGDVAIRVARESVQMHGAMGFAEEVDIGFYLRAALQAASLLGGPQQHRRRFVRFQSTSEDQNG